MGKSIKKILFVLSLLSSICIHVFATHIVGGELYYKCLGNNDYSITLKLYRDCFNGLAPFDDPAVVGIHDINGNLTTTLLMSFPGSTVLPVSLNNPCYQPPTNVCVEEAVYNEIINLPPIAGGYVLTYQRCCRNNTILNLNNPGNVGSTYTAVIPDQFAVPCNSSPHYVNLPPIFLCSDLPFTFDHSAIDIDGDSLVYDFCDPYAGGSPIFSAPNPPDPPPYNLVPFIAPYTGSYPMSSFPAMSIDPLTGLITGTPNMIGQWVVGVCVKEYRNGVFLSENKRDFQFNVTNCPNTTVSSIPSQQTFCFGNTVNFQNSSINSTTYHWDFGDPAVTNDTSGMFAPTWTYASPGVYNVTLIANPGLSCADTAVTTFQIYPKIQPDFVPPLAQCILGNSYDFTAGGTYMGNSTTTFSWDFGTNASPSTSSVKNPAGIVFNSVGSYSVTLTIFENGCSESFTDIVTVDTVPKADFDSEALVTCTNVYVKFKDLSVSKVPLIYSWDFGDGSISANKDPQHLFSSPGTYDIKLTVNTSNGCTDDTLRPQMITVNPIPNALFSVDKIAVSIFEPTITVTDQSTGAINCQLYFGDGSTSSDICSIVHTYADTGNYVITQVVTNVFGCTDTFSIPIRILPEYRFYVPNSFTPDNDGMNDVFMPSLMGVRNYSFLIFDRWSNKLFETDNPKNGWDGTYKNRKCQESVYIYRIKYEDVLENKEYQQIGTITLIR